MNTLKALENHLRGWIPKESTYANPFPAQTSQPNRGRITAYAGIFVGVFATVSLTMTAVYGLGLGNGYATVAAAVAGVAATIIVSLLLRAPSQNKPMPLTEGTRRAAKIMAGTKVGFVSVFLATYFLVSPRIESAELTLGIWIALLLTMFLVNNLLVRRFRKQTGVMEAL